MGILDAAFEFVSTVVKMHDGSYLSIQTDKPSYYAGELVTGKVVATIFNPKQADRVVVKVSGKEVVEWDDERSESIFEGEGENRRSRTIWHHRHHSAKHKIFKDVIIVSQLAHMLPAGTWEYPFQYQLRSDLPGCVKFSSHKPANDPEWRGRHLHTKAKIVYSFKAAAQNGQIFAKDIKGCQEVVRGATGSGHVRNARCLRFAGHSAVAPPLVCTVTPHQQIASPLPRPSRTPSRPQVVNSFFDWSKMQPAHADKSGKVWLCCCVPRGMVSVSADFDKSAYAAGETAQIKAIINNESKR